MPEFMRYVPWRLVSDRNGLRHVVRNAAHQSARSIPAMVQILHAKHIALAGTVDRLRSFDELGLCSVPPTKPFSPARLQLPLLIHFNLQPSSPISCQTVSSTLTSSITAPCFCSDTLPVSVILCGTRHSLHHRRPLQLRLQLLDTSFEKHTPPIPHSLVPPALFDQSWDRC